MKYYAADVHDTKGNWEPHALRSCLGLNGSDHLFNLWDSRVSFVGLSDLLISHFTLKQFCFFAC